MKLDLLRLLVCPQCGEGPLRCKSFGGDEGREIVNGVVWCSCCAGWYPVEDELLELLPGALAYAADRTRFWSTYQRQLYALNLQPPAPDTAGAEMRQQRHQQAHSDWYADNPKQTYSTYEHLPFWQAADAVAFGEWRKSIRPGARLMDIGCAQGRSTFKITDLDIEIVAFDVSKALISQAIARSKRERPRARTNFLVADATKLPFASESFDYVLVYGVLHHLADPAGTCRDVSRVLKPAGIYFGSENNRSAFRSIFELLQRLRPLWYEEAGEHAQISRRDLNRWLQPAGLKATIHTSIFLPPHVLNHLPPTVGEKLLAATDQFWNAIPGLRDQGGLIVTRAVKTSPR